MINICRLVLEKRVSIAKRRTGNPWLSIVSLNWRLVQNGRAKNFLSKTCRSKTIFQSTISEQGNDNCGPSGIPIRRIRLIGWRSFAVVLAGVLVVTGVSIRQYDFATRVSVRNSSYQCGNMVLLRATQLAGIPIGPETLRELPCRCGSRPGRCVPGLRILAPCHHAVSITDLDRSGVRNCAISPLPTRKMTTRQQAKLPIPRPSAARCRTTQVRFSPRPRQSVVANHRRIMAI